MVKKKNVDVEKNSNEQELNISSSTELKVVYRNPNDLKPNSRNSRKHSEKQIHKIAKSIKKLGFNNPILVDKKDVVAAGHGRLAAAKLLGLESVPTICLENLTPEQIRAYIIADNKIALDADWDKEILKIELEELNSLDLDFEIDVTGFETPEIDNIINVEVIEDSKKDKPDPFDKLPDESEIEDFVNEGDLWQCGNHKLYCGNALDEESYKILMQDELADVVFCDSPYNVKIQGNVTSKKSVAEFAMASGEMSKQEFAKLLRTAMALQAKYSRDGSIHFQCMDWRHMHEMLVAAQPIYSELKNLCIWDKISAGMGSMYRSSQELVFVYKNGTAPHINNVELGVHGRYRTNVWRYRGMHASNPQAKELLKLHPTVKPTALIMDALLDVSNPGSIVLDSFGGSGSTLIAAERTKRKARLIEISPHYCSIIVERFRRSTEKSVILLKNYKNNKEAI